MENLEIRKLIVRGGAMPLKGVKTLRAWIMLLALALPLTLTVPMASTANADELADAIKAQENGDHETALKILRSIVDQADAATQYDLGVMLENGEGIERDLKEAARLYRLAAEQGYASAQYNLALMYQKGEGVERDVKEAVLLYRLAAW